MEEHTIVDDVNRKILELLMDNSRIPYSELADAVGITRTPVKLRIDEMQKAGVIEKFTVLVPAKYMNAPLPVFFEIATVPQKIETIAQQVADHQSIAIVYQMSGSSTLHVHGYFKDIKEVSQFVNSYLARIEGITNIKSEFIIKRYKVNRSMLA